MKYKTHEKCINICCISYNQDSSHTLYIGHREGYFLRTIIVKNQIIFYFL